MCVCVCVCVWVCVCVCVCVCASMDMHCFSLTEPSSCGGQRRSGGEQWRGRRGGHAHEADQRSINIGAQASHPCANQLCMLLHPISPPQTSSSSPLLPTFPLVLLLLPLPLPSSSSSSSSCSYFAPWLPPRYFPSVSPLPPSLPFPLPYDTLWYISLGFWWR